MWTHLDKREKRALRSTNFIEASYSKPEQHLSFTQKFGDNVSATGTQTKVLGITEECWLIKICILFRKTSYWEIRSKDRSQPYPHKNVEQNFGTLEVLLTSQEPSITYIKKNVTYGGSVKKHLIFTKSENSKKFRGRVNVINSALYHATTKWILIQYRLKLKIVLSRESCRAPNVIVCQAPNLTIFRQAPKFQLSEECLWSG